MIDREPLDDLQVKVTFRIPNVSGASKAAVVGEFNDWSPEASTMILTDDGFERTITLAAGSSYRFRYLLDGARWENDWQADRYLDNNFGGHDSVIDLT